MSQFQLILEKQWVHILGLAALITGLVLLGPADRIRAGSLGGVDTSGFTIILRNYRILKEFTDNINQATK